MSSDVHPPPSAVERSEAFLENADRVAGGNSHVFEPNTPHGIRDQLLAAEQKVELIAWIFGLLGDAATQRDCSEVYPGPAAELEALAHDACSDMIKARKTVAVVTGGAQ